jgi:hypothetical protein
MPAFRVVVSVPVRFVGSRFGVDAGQGDAALGQCSDNGGVEDVGGAGIGRVGPHAWWLVGVEQGGGGDAAPRVVGADKQHPPLRSRRCHCGVSWLAAWVGWPPRTCPVQVWAAIWTASQGLPNGGV